MKTDYLIATALAKAWTLSGIEAEVWKGANHCIEATKLALWTLRRFKVPAHPLPCGIIIANTEAQALIEAHVPIPDWPPSAWSVGVDPDQRQGGKGWDGHLIVEGDGWIADYAAAQFSRPTITIEAWASPTPPEWVLHDGAGQFSGGDTVVTVFPRRKLARWRSSNAWRSTEGIDIVNRLEKLVTTDVAEALAGIGIDV